MIPLPELLVFSAALVLTPGRNMVYLIRRKSACR